MFTFIYRRAGSLSPLSRRLYDNELPSSANQLRPWLQPALIMRGAAAVAPVFVCSPPAAGARSLPLPTMRDFSTFLPLELRSEPPEPRLWGC